MPLYNPNTPATDGSDEISNLTIVATVGSSAMTIALKDKAGSDATSASPIRVGMRSATVGSGAYSLRTITSAASLVISSGSTLGHNSGTQHPVYVYVIDNAGTEEVGASTTFFGWSGIGSTTAEGGAGAADSNRVIYSTTARSGVAFRCVGRLLSTQTTAGTWAAVPTQIDVTPFNVKPIEAIYTTNAGASVGAIAIFNYATKVSDFYACVATGVSWAFTAPKTATYRVSATVATASATWSLNNALTIQAFINGTSSKSLGRQQMAAAGTYGAWAGGSLDIQLGAGETLSIRVQSSQSVATITNIEDNNVSIVEVL